MCCKVFRFYCHICRERFHLNLTEWAVPKIFKYESEDTSLYSRKFKPRLEISVRRPCALRGSPACVFLCLQFGNLCVVLHSVYDFI
ncbi:receptor accessory protein 5 (predicted), isoform CRA_a [Rattus norvegicus]|uniref:Receptor accessory protein 5 (Predicted), isoform CRA_a n=1 Tax=Rattus norvegicus TaxID=10116 RepID=A6J2U1_RAT|nr:receptor accessory protein 5 (predicted), isoform CRA_a [Rattus norvegicus]